MDDGTRTNGKVNKADRKAALERAQAFIAQGDSQLPGKVCGVPNDPNCRVGTRTDLHYYWFDLAEMDGGKVAKLRAALEARGFWPVDPTVGAYVSDCATAEIWATTWEVKEALFSAKKQRNDKARNAMRPRAIFTPQL